MSQGYASAGLPLDLPWKLWTPTLVDITLGNGTQVARFVGESGGLIVAHYELLFGSSTTIDGGNPTISTPLTASASYTTPRNHLGPAYMNDAGSTAFPGMVRLESATTFSLSVFNPSGTHVENISVSATVPMTWEDGDLLSFTAIFEAAA